MGITYCEHNAFKENAPTMCSSCRDKKPYYSFDANRGYVYGAGAELSLQGKTVPEKPRSDGGKIPLEQWLIESLIQHGFRVRG